MSRLLTQRIARARPISITGLHRRVLATWSAGDTNIETTLSLGDKHSSKNAELAFRTQSTYELLRASVVFRLCQSPWLVRNSSALLRTSYRFLGDFVTNSVLRWSFFGHFCGGENAQELQGTVMQRYKKAGIGTILDYAAEADISTHIDCDKEEHKFDEQQWEANAAIARSSINASPEGGFNAIKVTALGNPELLYRVSEILQEGKSVFHKLMEIDPEQSSSPVSSRRQLQKNAKDMTESEVSQFVDIMDDKGTEHSEFLDWMRLVDPNDVSMGPLTRYMKKTEPLGEEEKRQLADIMLRLEPLAETARDNKVRLLIDAEHTYMQPAIDFLVTNLQRKYNTVDNPTIFNTYQCYLRDSESRIRSDLARARREGYGFACKLVRGAYMLQERQRAAERNYPDPIHESKEATDANYDAMVDFLLKEGVHFMVASHNEDSVQKTLELMAKKNVPKTDSGVFFGQLRGMCDHVSYSLGGAGYQVYKYVPYGPVFDVLPYLIRRVEENSDMMSGAAKETELVNKELWRRMRKLMPFSG